jgi:arylsulfatase A-like enzyme
MGVALEWLERHAADRVFLFVHTYVVHWPYSAPKEFRSATFKDANGVERPLSQAKPIDGMKWAYAAEVRHADAQIGRLVDAIQRLGIADRTLLIVTSDHGEEFEEHGNWSHSHSVYDELLHVPLVLWAPGRVPEGKRIRTPTSLVDLVPTVLDLVGLPPPTHIDGETQAPRIRGAAAEDADRVVFAEVHPGARNPFHLVAAHGLTEKWILRDASPPTIFAYDLAADPGERAPLDDPARLERGRRQLARYDALGGDAGGPITNAPVDPATEERLKALGYVQ